MEANTDIGPWRIIHPDFPGSVGGEVCYRRVALFRIRESFESSNLEKGKLHFDIRWKWCTEPKIGNHRCKKTQSHLELTVRAVAVFSGPGDASAREVPDLVTVNAGDNSRVDICSSHLAARRRLQVGTRHRYSNRHRHAAPVTKRVHSLDVAPTTNNILGCRPLLIYSFQFKSTF